VNALREECWAISDDAAGNQRQALALAERLGLPVRPLELAPRAPWAWFAPRLILGGARALPGAESLRAAQQDAGGDLVPPVQVEQGVGGEPARGPLPFAEIAGQLGAVLVHRCVLAR
jgi:hypothetical protein